MPSLTRKDLMKCVKRVRSPTLAAIVSSVVSKVLKILESRFLEKVKRIGRAIAQKICRIALGWGNVSASSWKHDSGFVRLLGVNAIDTRGVKI